jgi:hypothetical protein
MGEGAYFVVRVKGFDNLTSCARHHYVEDIAALSSPSRAVGFLGLTFGWEGRGGGYMQVNPWQQTSGSTSRNVRGEERGGVIAELRKQRFRCDISMFL